jgi:autotransporter passenger strand-loop-strand repeat protein
MSGYNSTTSGSFNYQTIGDQDTVQIVSGGSAYGNTVLSGGSLIIANGTAESNVIDSAGNLYLYSGTANYNTVNSGGSMQISDGTGTGNTVSMGNFGIGGGVVSGTAVYGGTVYVSGGAAYGTVMANGGEQEVSSGAASYGAIANSGGYEYVDSGGVDYSTQLNSGAFEEAGLGGVASDTTVAAGGTIIFAGGNANIGDETATVLFGPYTYIAFSAVYSNGTETYAYTSGGQVEEVIISRRHGDGHGLHLRRPDCEHLPGGDLHHAGHRRGPGRAKRGHRLLCRRQCRDGRRICKWFDHPGRRGRLSHRAGDQRRRYVHERRPFQYQ